MATAWILKQQNSGLLLTSNSVLLLNDIQFDGSDSYS